MIAKGKKIVIVGATSAIAEHCARLWALESPATFFLAGRNREKLERVAADLEVRTPGTEIHCWQVDFYDPAAIRKFADDVCAKGSVDTVLIAHGSLPDQALCQSDLQQCREAIVINAQSPVLFAEAFAGHMENAGSGMLALIGSVAGDRGRKSNYVYGAAKGLVDRYAQGLQHRLAATGVTVAIIKPGPTDTPMTAALKEQGVNLAPADRVAASIVRGMRKGKATIYTPARWALIMLIIRHLPRFVFNKMDI